MEKYYPTIKDIFTITIMQLKQLFVILNPFLILLIGSPLSQ